MGTQPTRHYICISQQLKCSISTHTSHSSTLHSLASLKYESCHTAMAIRVVTEARAAMAEGTVNRSRTVEDSLAMAAAEDMEAARVGTVWETLEAGFPNQTGTPPLSQNLRKISTSSTQPSLPDPTVRSPNTARSTR